MDTLLFESQKTLGLQTPRQFRHALEAVVNECVADLAIRQRMLLCLSEAVTNLVVHATPKPEQLSLRFANDAHGWYLTIFDDSSAWAPEQKLDDNLLFKFETVEHGRGIALLHSQCDHLSYTPGVGEQPNQLILYWSYPQAKTQQTVLVVEDNNSLRLLYQAYLSGDFNVLTAINGYQALKQLSQHKIDLVLSDIRMPEMNGLSLRKKINQQDSSELIPFIFLTAEDDQMIQDQALELGIDDYLIKPVNKPQLLSIINRVLARSKRVYQQLTDRIDKKISASLTPSLPETANGWRFQVASRNTGSGGGDLLLHKSFTGMTQLLLTDIMGHDDSAKFFAHAYGGYMHGLMQAMETDNSPAQLLEQISNCALSDKVLSQITLTCCSVQLSPGGKISIATAGHPAPLLISQQNIQTVATTGVLPGLLADVNYQSTELSIKQGERLALFTDGLFESAADNDSRNELQASISAALLATLDLPIGQSMQQVMTLFDQITATQPSDDALLLLIEPVAAFSPAC